VGIGRPTRFFSVYSTARDPVAGWQGTGCFLPKNLISLLVFQASGLGPLGFIQLYPPYLKSRVSTYAHGTRGYSREFVTCIYTMSQKRGTLYSCPYVR